MKRTLLFLCFLWALSPSVVRGEDPASGQVDPKTKEIANEAILSIYQDVLAEKENYKELSAFGPSALYENQQGIYAIVYEYKGTSERPYKTPYAFGLTIDRIDDRTFPSRATSFNFSFPLLDVKMSGYLNKHLLRTQFDLMPLVQKYGMVLGQHQQSYMPLRMELRPLQDVYYTREDIEFEVVLKNVTKRHMWVRHMGPENLYFLIDNMAWGTYPTSAVGQGASVILRSGDSISLRLKGESFQRPKEFEIYSVYSMSIQGVNPSATLKINVVDRPASKSAP
ncbi:MAG: hypothetical protein Q8Q08_01620 [Candidatus Omnitrophota bacterium]|nr:hypothetical protein [Candidatus Omnitrophota bacterium]